MIYYIIKTETITTTEVYKVDVEERTRYPLSEDLAISATVEMEPIAKEVRRDINYEPLRTPNANL